MGDKCYKCGQEAEYEISINGVPRDLCGDCTAELLAMIKSDPDNIKKVTVWEGELDQ